MSGNVTFYTSVGSERLGKATQDCWAKLGYNVIEINSARPEEYRAAVSNLNRLFIRWKMYVEIVYRSVYTAYLFRKNENFRIFTTNPFYLSWVLKLFGPKKGKTILLLYDLYPDILVLADKLRSDSLLFKLVFYITKKSIISSDSTVFLGERLRNFANSKYGFSRHDVVIPIGADSNPFRDAPPEIKVSDKPLIILYVGMMGHMHDISTLLGYWETAPIGGIEWDFFSSGIGYKKICHQVNVLDKKKSHYIKFNGPLNDSDWIAIMKSSPIALITVLSGAENYMIPSKAYSSIMAGQAVLAICERESDLADMIVSHDCGWVVKPGDITQLRQVLAEIIRDPSIVHRKRVNAFNAAHKYYSIDALSVKWQQLFGELELLDDKRIDMCCK